MDKTFYPAECFKRNKSVSVIGLRLCYEVKNKVYVTCVVPTKTKVALTRYISRVRELLSGSPKNEVLRELSDALASKGYPMSILMNMTAFPVQELGQLLKILIKLLIAGQRLEQSLITNIDAIAEELLRRSDAVDYSLVRGLFLRSLMRYPAVHERLLNVRNIKMLHFTVMETQFGVSSDAFESFKSLLFSEHQFVLDFAVSHVALLLEELRSIHNKEYYYRRQGLNLLFNLLTIQGNTWLADQYARDEGNLKEMMTLMKYCGSDQIKNQGFYLFGVILKRLLAGQPATQLLPAFRILLKNRGQLIAFFETFLDSNDSLEFHSDKQEILKTLRKGLK